MPLRCDCISVSAGTRQEWPLVELTAETVVKKSAAAAAVAGTQEVQVADVSDSDEEKIPDWIRCSPADLYFKRDRVIITHCLKKTIPPNHQ